MDRDTRLAWRIADLSRAAKLPPLENLLRRRRAKREMTPDEQWAVMMPMTYSKH